MAIFGCTNARAHDTMPRGKGRVHRPALSQMNANASSPSARGPAVHNSPLARSMSRRNGNGAKLQKRSRVNKSMIGKPSGFEHVSHSNKEDALHSKELQDATEAMRQPALPSSETMIISNPEKSQKSSTDATIPMLEDQLSRQSHDQPGRKPTINKRKGPPPITPSIIKAAGLPPSLATKTATLPLASVSPAKSVQGLRATPVKLKAKRQSKVPVVHEVLEQHDRPLNTDIDGLAGLISDIPLEGTSLGSASDDPASPPAGLSPSRSTVPTRSITLQNLALSESMENMVKHVEEMPTQEDDIDNDLKAPRPVAASPSGPLAYMTDSTKIRWDNGMAEIARQLKDQS